MLGIVGVSNFIPHPAGIRRSLWTETGEIVLHMCKELPYTTHKFNVYMDNFFSHIRLLTKLRLLGIGACGTVRSTSADYPDELKLRSSKALAKVPWNTFKSKNVGPVRVVAWRDFNAIQMLTTIHNVTVTKGFSAENVTALKTTIGTAQ